MPPRDLNGLRAGALDALSAALADAAADPDAETALSRLTGAALRCLGDGAAAARPGALKQGERQFKVSGVFLLSPDGRESVLVADHGFPPEQRRLRIPSDHGHPGWVVRHRRALIIPNTDENADFKQILKTARMGSAMYCPMLFRGRMLGQFISAAQARNTFAEPDHALHILFGHAATSVLMAQDGAAFLAGL